MKTTRFASSVLALVTLLAVRGPQRAAAEEVALDLALGALPCVKADADPAETMAAPPSVQAAQEKFGAVPSSAIFAYGLVCDSTGHGAKFNGSSSRVAIDPVPELNPGSGEFTIALDVDIAADGSTKGDLVSWFDPKSRTGLNLGLYSHSGVAGTHSNTTQLHFGVDAAWRDTAWRREAEFGAGRNSSAVSALAVHDGALYAGTLNFDNGKGGRVMKYVGPNAWTDMKIPAVAEQISSLVSHNGMLCAGTMRNRWGSQLHTRSDRAATKEGGEVLCLTEDGKRWVSLGEPDRGLRLGQDSFPDGGRSISSFISLNHELYAAPVYTWGVYRYRGDKRWEYIGTPFSPTLQNPMVRVMALGEWRGDLFAALNDSGGVARYDGATRWTNLGLATLQNYALETYQGRLHVGTFSTGEVYALEDGGQWAPVGRLGDENEVMTLISYNGLLYGGTIPSAAVFVFIPTKGWESLGVLESAEGAPITSVEDGFRGGLRRVSAMAVYGGRLFAGTMPSGLVYSREMGRNATYDRTIPAGRHHIAAVRRKAMLELYVDGKRVATSAPFEGVDLDVFTGRPFYVGFGQSDFLKGSVDRVQLYKKALDAEAIAALAAAKESSAQLGAQ